MKHDWKHEQDLADAKLRANTIIMKIFEAGFIDSEVLENALDFGMSKIADDLYQYGDDIREHCKSAYKLAITERIEEIEP